MKTSPPLWLVALFLLAGCTAAPSLFGGAPSGTAVVTLAGWSRQAQAMPTDVSTVSLSVTPLGGNPYFGKRQEVKSSPTGTASAAFTGLSPGTWRVEATALGAGRAVLGTATADAMVQAGQTASVTLALGLAPTSGLQIDLGIGLGHVRWNSLMPEASESVQVALDFANTNLDYDGNRWQYLLTDATGTRSATYSVLFSSEFGTTDLQVELEGQDPVLRTLDPLTMQDDLHAMPVMAVLAATGSETVLGQERPFRRFTFTLRYPYQNGHWVQVRTDRWVAPGIGAYREETEEDDQGAIATRSLELTGSTLP